MRGGAAGPKGWQLLWAGAGHGFLIQTRTQEWRKGEFAVAKLTFLSKKMKGFASSISCGWRRVGNQASPWEPSPSTPSWVGTGRPTACKFEQSPQHLTHCPPKVLLGKPGLCTRRATCLQGVSGLLLSLDHLLPLLLPQTLSLGHCLSKS